MQNIDFSSRLNRSSPFQAVHANPQSRQAGGVADVPVDIKRRNRNMVFVLALLILAFTVGMMAGIQLGYLRHVDETLVKHPDPDSTDVAGESSAEQGATTSFSNTGADSASQNALEGTADQEGNAGRVEGRYLVRIGTFAPRAAELLAGRLNNHPDLAQAKPVRCKNVRESAPGRYLAFRVKLGDDTDRQNVFLGCFRSEDAAREALDAAIASGIPGLSAARLFEIE